jgi:preprotein translocase subunit SecA
MIISQIKKLVISEYTKNPNLDKKKLIEKINNFLDTQAINDTLEIDDVSAIETPEVAAKYISDIAIKEFEKIKKKAISEEEFYDLERRIVLGSIDDLWMRHIDSMSKLREEVAFEGYAQRQPLVVYKTKAYGKFEELLGELEYKVTKIIFGLDKQEP